MEESPETKRHDSAQGPFSAKLYFMYVILTIVILGGMIFAGYIVFQSGLLPS